MNKQDLRFSYLGYFAGQYAKKEDIDFDTLENMAAGDSDLERIVLKELINEGLIEGIDVFEDEHASRIAQYSGKIKLTAKGLKEILNIFPEEKKEIIEDIKSDIENQNKKILTVEDLINKEKERISKLSDKEKEEEIKIKILEYFQFLNSEINKYENKQISDKELKEKIKKIITHYFSSNQLSYAKLITKNLFLEDYITYFIKNAKSADFVDISKLLTLKGKTFLKDLQKQEKAEIDKYYKEHNIKPIIDNLPIGTIKVYQSIANPALIAAMNQLPAPYSVINNFGLSSTINQLAQVQSTLNTPYVNNVLNNLKSPATEAAIKSARKGLSEILNSPPSGLYAKLIEKPEEKLETFTFEGILGQNCGEVEKYINSSKQLQAKDFIVSRGLRVLRGFAKASTLFEASRAEYDYQRPLNGEHLDSLKNFLLNMKDSAKYLPEVTLVARKNFILEEFSLNSKTLSDTQKGIIKNLNYHKVKVKSNSLYRIDGNHRIEAAYKLYQENQKDLYLPFSIILWNLEDYIGDGSAVWEDMIDEERKENESFLFYFLNSKAKKLEVEENLQGIIKASRTRWRDEDLKIANPILSLMRLYQEQMQTQIYLNDELCQKESLKQIAEILTQINNNEQNAKIDLEQFKSILLRTNSILNTYKPKKLKDFKFYCKLVFYVAYKHNVNGDCLEILNNLDDWVYRNNFDNSTFEDPVLLYNNAEKSKCINAINIFVAMPYDEDNIENYTTWIEDSIQKIKEKNIKLGSQLNLNKIMPNRGYAINLIETIMDEIRRCDIFIADISPCIMNINGEDISCDANPNVMYELGIAHNLKKPIILMREDVNFPKVPSDIQEKYRNTYKRTNTKKTQQTIQKAIEYTLEEFFV